MLDLHALSSGGGTSLTAISTILAGGDGQTVAGVPIGAGAALVGWGGLTTIADTIKELKLTSQDQLDPVNNEDYVTGGTAAGIVHFWDYLTFAKGARSFSMAQNTAGANNIAYTLDLYPGGPVTQNPWYGKAGLNAYTPRVFAGALTAITWGTQALATGSAGSSFTAALPAGKYAIQGAVVSSLTNYGLLRFQHADFGPFLPGFPVVDPNATAARAVLPGLGADLLVNANGYQFSYMSQLLGVPCEPIFTVQANATGLTIQAAAITTDTPEILLNLIKVA